MPTCVILPVFSRLQEKIYSTAQADAARKRSRAMLTDDQEHPAVIIFDATVHETEKENISLAKSAGEEKQKALYS
jgi:hypothetical protein